MKNPKANQNELAEVLARVSGSDLAGQERTSLEQFYKAPPETLQALLLSRMNLAANLQRDIGDLVSRLAEALSDAKLAQLLLELKTASRNGRKRQ